MSGYVKEILPGGEEDESSEKRDFFTRVWEVRACGHGRAAGAHPTFLTMGIEIENDLYGNCTLDLQQS